MGRSRKRWKEYSPAAAGPRVGRDRVLAIRRSRSPERSLIKGENTPLGFENVFAARGDPTSPNATANGRKTTGYVGQAAHPPCQGFLGLLRLTRMGSRRMSLRALGILLKNAFSAESAQENSRGTTTSPTEKQVQGWRHLRPRYLSRRSLAKAEARRRHAPDTIHPSPFAFPHFAVRVPPSRTFVSIRGKKCLVSITARMLHERVFVRVLRLTRNS